MMRKFLLALLLAVVASVCASAQTTTVTGTITDLNGNPYFPGTASAFRSVSTGQNPGPPTTVATTAGGVFSMVISSGVYQFTMCASPVNIGPTTNPTPVQVCFISSPIVVSGGSQDVSATLNAIAQQLGPRLGGSGGSGLPSGGLIGQIPVNTAPGTGAWQSSGIADGNAGLPVTTTPYAVLCDSATAIRDRLTAIRFQSGASVINTPDHTASGCGSGFTIVLLDDGAGTLTVNRGGSDTFSTFNGSTNTDGATSFTLTNGQYATLNNGAGGVWEVRIVSGGGGGTAAACTDNPVAGVLPVMNTSGHVYCLAANSAYTFSTAQTISANNVTIVLAGPGTTITRTSGTTDLFDVSGIGDTIISVPLGGILDGGSLNGGPLVNVTNNNATVDSIKVQNFGTSNPAIVSTVSDQLVINKLNCPLALYRCVELVSSGGAVTNYHITNGYFSTVNSASAPTFLIHIQKSGGTQIGPGEVTSNTIIGRDGVGNSYPLFIDGPSAAGGVESCRVISNHFGLQATLHAPLKIFGVDHCVIANNTFRDDGNTTANGQIYLGDFYHSTVTANDINQTAATPANGINMTDGEGDTITANVIHGFNNGGFGDTAGIHLNTAAGNCSHNIITANEVYFQSGTAGDGIEVFSSTNGFACNDNLVAGNKIVGTGSANQVGIHLTLSGTGTATDNKATNNHLFNLATGVKVDASVTPVEVSDQYFHTVTTPVNFAAAVLFRQFPQGITFAQAPVVANLSNGSLWFETDGNASCGAGASTGKFCVKENGAIAGAF